MNDTFSRRQVPEQEIKLKNGRTVRVRNARSSDAELFLGFFDDLSAQSRDFMHGWAKLCAPERAPEWADQLAAKAKSEDHFALVVLSHDDAEERMIGYCWIDGVTSGHCLGDLPGLGIGIVDAYHCVGLGKALMQRVLEAARDELHLARVRLGVFVDNPRALRAYEAAGFRQDPDMPPKDFDGCKELYMVACMESERPIQRGRQTVKVESNVRVPMRDDVHLATDVMIPDGDGPFPVILTRTPYGKDRFSVKSPELYVNAGYVFVAQDCRGRYKSEGDWFPFVNEAQDGYDTIEWIAKQPWSDGRIGMIGGSYQGIDQWAAVSTCPPHLCCIVPQETPADLYGDMVYRAGALQLVTFYLWALYVDGPGGRECRVADVTPEMFRTLPLTAADQAAGHSRIPYWQEWLKHPRYDDFWRDQNFKTAIRALKIPVLNIEGWFDMYAQSATSCFAALQAEAGSPEARRHARAILGPWCHGAWCTGRGSRSCGDLDFGEDAEFDVRGMEIRFFDRHLKQEDNGLDAEPPLSVFVMGRNRWLRGAHWPLPETQWRRLYLHSRGNANSADGDGVLSYDKPEGESCDQFTYDPHDPIPTLGGPHSGNAAGGTPVLAGPHDQRSIEQRDDVLVYTSAPLQEDLDVIGPIVLHVLVASSAPDTDFTGKLVDVYPDGRAIVICESILRASYRSSSTEPSPITPGTVYALTIELGATANCFQRGHCVRLEVSSSNFPRYSRNLNTGLDSGSTAEVATARQTVYHERGRESWIELPVVDVQAYGMKRKYA